MDWLSPQPEKTVFPCVQIKKEKTALPAKKGKILSPYPVK